MYIIHCIKHSWIFGAEIVFNVLNDELDEFVSLVEQDRDEQVANLLLCVFVGREQVDRLNVAKVHVVPEEEDEQQFTNVLLLVVPI